jgi:hypothetical protein
MGRAPEKEWNSSIYALYHPVLDIGYYEGHHYYEFKCMFEANCHCKSFMLYYVLRSGAN